MKVAILKVGIAHFAFPNVAEASRALVLLNRAVLVEPEIQGKHVVFLPERLESYRQQLSMEIVDASQLKKRPEAVPEARRLGFTDPL